MVVAPIPPADLCGTPAQLPVLAPELGVNDVATMLGCSTALVYEEAHRGKIKHVRLGKAFRFRREWVEAYLAAVTVTPEGYAPATIPEAI